MFFRPDETLQHQINRCIIVSRVWRISMGARNLSMVALLIALNVVPIQAASAGESSTKDADNIKIANFEKVSKALWRGAAPGNRGMDDLARAGARTVIDLRMGDCTKESADAQKHGLKYFHIPVGYGTPTVDKVNQFLGIVTTAKYQPVFIHCRQGADRTGTFVGIYRMAVEGWSFDQAYEDMREHHFKPWMFSLKHATATWEPARGANAQSQVAQKQGRSL